MAIEYLGQHFDIHSGGVDHIPVHHNNEIAQSKAYLGDGEPWVEWWLHGEFINLKGAKISKSTGGGVLVSDLADRGYHPLVYRYLLLQAHYRSQVEFSWNAMDSARAGLRRLLDRCTLARLEPAAELGEAASAYLEAFNRAICDDLNTARALAVVAAASRDALVPDGELTALVAKFEALLGVGLTNLEPGDLDLKRSDVAITEEEVEALVAERKAARHARDFAKSDALRDQLTNVGVVVEDHAGGTSTWRWA